MVKAIIILLVGLRSSIAIGQELVKDTQSFTMQDGTVYTYQKPKFFDMVTEVPKDLIDLGKFVVQKENLIWTSAALGSTLALLPFDQKLLDNAQELGEPLGLADDVRYIRVFQIELIPQDINGAIYYLGNGLTPILVSSGFYLVGLINDDYRALNTSSELIEVLISSGVVTQTIKRVTGRESPVAAIENGNPGGHWTPFPSFKAYQTQTPSYDAMPSGHLTTYMAALTVLTTNYPDNKYLKPIGYSLMALLGFEMMSSRVHWVSDYPLAILIGYAIGKNAANRRIKKEPKLDTTGNVIKKKIKTDFSFSSTSNYNIIGVTFTF